MRRLAKFLILFVTALGLSILGMGNANAGNSFNGQDANPQYMTGITEVYAWSEQGNFISVPVYSMEPCKHEDGSGQIACVWVSSQRGNLIGDWSFLKLGDGQTATISNVSAEILVIPGLTSAPVVSQPVSQAPVSQPVSQPVSDIVEPIAGQTEDELMSQVIAEYGDVVAPAETEWNDYGVYTGNKAPCANEDSSQVSCYWDAQTMGLNNGGTSFTVDHEGNYIFGKNH